MAKLQESLTPAVWKSRGEQIRQEVFAQLDALESGELDAQRQAEIREAVRGRIKTLKHEQSQMIGYLAEEAIAGLQSGSDLFTFPGLTLTQSTEESKALNADKTPKIILSASGMCDAGRIRHHLKHNLWRPECAVVFVGYQGEGTLGRRLLEGAKTVKLFGEEIAVQARIVNFKGLSSHADRTHLLSWVKNFSPKPQQVFVVHGDSPVTELFAKTLNDELGVPAHAPLYEEVYDLTENRLLAPGVVLASKPRPAGASAGSQIGRASCRERV